MAATSWQLGRVAATVGATRIHLPLRAPPQGLHSWTGWSAYHRRRRFAAVDRDASPQACQTHGSGSAVCCPMETLQEQGVDEMKPATGDGREVHLVLRGAGGTGLAVCRQLHDRGAEVIVGTREPERARSATTAYDQPRGLDWRPCARGPSRRLCRRGISSTRGSPPSSV